MAAGVIAVGVPAVWTTDRECCQAVGVPESVGFATKPQLVVGMLARLLGRLPAAWVAADAVYGPDTWLRAWLEGRGVGYVLGIRASDHLEVASGAGRLPARELTGHLEAGRLAAA